MEPHDVFEERLGDRLCSVGVSQGEKMTIFTESVHHRQDDGLPAHTRKSLHEVEADVRPDPGWNRQGQQQAGRLEVLGLETLASSAGAHEVPDVPTHLGKVEVTPEAVERALDSFVAILMHGSKELQ